MGDTLYACRSLAADLGPCELVLYKAPHKRVRDPFTADKVERLRSFLELQEYILGVKYAEQPEGVILDDWRTHYEGRMNLADMVANTFNVREWPSDVPWLQVDQPTRVARVVIHRSPRYHSKDFPWREVVGRYGEQAVMVGSRDEHAVFVREFGPIKYHGTPTLLDLARVIAGADLFVGNQSTPLALAHGLKKNVWVEEYPGCPNCHFERANAWYGADPDTFDKITCHLTRGHTLVTDDRLRTIARLVESVKHLPGDMAELGVYKGGTAKVMAWTAPKKLLHLYDTFAGLPEDDADPRGVHRRGEFAAGLEGVKEYLNGHDIEYHVGRFIGADLVDRQFSFVHLDGDLYQSTIDGIRYFWPRLVSGGVMVWDDYGWKSCPGVERAVKELLPGVEVTVAGQHGWAVKA